MIRRYCSLRDLPEIENWTFYLAFSFFRMAAIAQGVYSRALAGNAIERERNGVQGSGGPSGANGARRNRRCNSLKRITMDFAPSPRATEMHDRLKAFMQAHIYPRIRDHKEEIEAGNFPVSFMEDLKSLAPRRRALEHVPALPAG